MWYFYTVCHEENFSATQEKSNKNSRFPRENKHRGRTSRFEEKNAKGQTRSDSPIPVKMSKIRGQALRKREKLMEKTRYVRVLKKGKRLSSQNFSLVIAKNGLDFARIGQVVAKKYVPRAVSRNKIKRYFREIFRQNKPRFGCGDFIFMAKNDVSGMPFGEVRAEIMSMMGGEK